jgi:hypothetical protein
MQQPMIILGKHSITIRPELPERLIGYVKFGRDAMKRKLHEVLDDQNIPDDDPATLTTIRQIEEVEALISQLEQLQDRLSHVHYLNFYLLADVIRKTLDDLEFKRIEEVYTIEVLVANLMEVLKAANPYFSKEKFINYINNGGKTV